MISTIKALRPDVGGRWLGYLPAWLVVGPLWVLFSIFLTPSAYQPGGLVPILIGNVLGVLAACAFLAFLNITLLRNRSERPVALLWVIFFGALMGTIKALVSNVVIYSIITPVEPVSLLQRIGLVAVLGAWLLPTISIVLATRERLERERSNLIRERVRDRFATASRSIEAGKDGALSHNLEVVEFINKARAQIHLDQTTDVLAEQLRSLIDNELRTLSHNLWQQESRETPSFRFRDLIRLMYVRHSFSTVPTLLGFVLLFLLPQITFAGTTTGIARTAVQLAVIALVFEIAKRLPRSSVTLGAVVYLAVNLALPWILESLSNWLFGPIPGVYSLASYLLLLTYFLISGVVFGIFTTAFTEREEIALELEKLLDQKSQEHILSASQHFQRNELAQFLHSHVQNGMLNIALRLEVDDQRRVSEDEKNLIESLLTEIIQFERPFHSENLRSGLSSVAKRWEGFVTVAIEIVEVHAPPLSKYQIHLLLLVANEAITNAVRHGEATMINLEFRLDVAGTQIFCTDNGIGPRSPRGQGLGSGLFNSAAGQMWKLSRKNQETILMMNIPHQI